MLTDDLELAGGSPAPSYSLILEGPTSTVCAQVPEVARTATSYQTEAQLEDELIAQLVDQGYERISPTSEAELVANLRRQIGLLNGCLLYTSNHRNAEQRIRHMGERQLAMELVVDGCGALRGLAARAQLASGLHGAGVIRLARGALLFRQFPLLAHRETPCIKI